ncbi:hypothetical protein ACS5PN_30085 [Roseateles sp. NT4]|uniref:hypothetical protein n=1 Tax=Roseateles sp. NT4 TaxID=3453715 RepID=UPI003EEE3D99
MKHLLLSSLFALALAGCASTPAPTTNTAANDGGATCEKEVSTGSMLSKSRCRTAEQREAERAGVAATADAIRQQRNLPPGK